MKRRECVVRYCRAGVLLAGAAAWVVAAEGAGPAGAATTNPQAADAHAGAWGERAGAFQSRLTVTGDATKGGPLHVVADLRNVSDAKVPVTQIRVWLMLAQGPSLVFYTAPYAAAPKSLDGGQAMEIPFEASDLNAFKYVADLVIRDGMPMPPNLKAPAPKPVGTVAEVLPTGVVKLKAFVVVEEKVAEAAGAAEAGGDSKGKTDVIASATLSIKVAELAAGDWSHLNDAAKQAFFAELTADFHGDAVAGKNAHDRAVKVGKEITPRLLTLLDDKEVSSAGRMWLAATLVDLHDDRAIDALIKILEKGGAAAAVVAYHGPKIKNAKLTAAIERVAATTKDASLTAWAVRGLGINGEKTDAALLEAMVTHSDAAGRAEAAEILAGHPDPKALPLLAKLIADQDATVRLQAIRAAVQHHKAQSVILDALSEAAKSNDPRTQKAAQEALRELAAR